MRKRYEMQGAESDPLEDLQTQKLYRRKNSIHSVSPAAALLFVTALFGVYGLVYLFDRSLPTPLNLVDEKDNPESFIAGRAQHDLKLLTSVGPRVAGSYENEAVTVDFFKREIMFIQQQAHAGQKIELDVQVVTGSYFLDFKPHGAINSYSKVQNVVVKLHSGNNSEHSLLVNAHFDSVPTSPGGSDDGIMCVTMLEVLRKLSRSPHRLLHNVLFLFNGAEESPLQAAHGFITQHKWAKEARVVINLEAAGAGGKEILFQAGPGQPWLLDYYRKVPHPYGQAAGEELFQSGLIPSDTDFRLFRDFGNLIGFDFAFAKNGYRYHTKYDDFSNIPLGSYQHVGDNALSLIRNLANAPELSDPKGQPKGNTVFYDYLGLFMISYTQTMTILLNVIVSLVSTLLALKSFYDFGLGFSRHSFTYIGLTAAAVLLGLIAAALIVVGTALIIDALRFTMSWYNNPWIIFGLYAVPVFACTCGCISVLNHFYDKHNLSISAQAQIQAHVLRLIWTVPLLVGTFYGIRSVYVFLVPLLFQTLTAGIIQIFSLQYSVRKWQNVYVLGTIVPSIFSMRQGMDVAGLLVPMCGRIGPDRNPEIYIGLLTILITVLITTYFTPLITLVRKQHLVLACLGAVFLVFFAIVFTPAGFPYSGNPESPAPQRFWIYHTSRIFRNETNDVYKRDSGFFVLNMDRNSPGSVRKYVKDLSKAKSIAEDCKMSLFCGLPIVTTRMIAILPDSTWIPAGQPIIHEPISLKLNSKTKIGVSTTRFNFTASGPSQFTLYISPKTDASLTKISLVPEVPPEPPIWNGRPTYIILHTWAKENTPLNFSIDFETGPNWAGPVFDIALTGTHKNDKTYVKTPHFLKFISEFPNWADVVPYLGAYESWIF